MKKIVLLIAVLYIGGLLGCHGHINIKSQTENAVGSSSFSGEVSGIGIYPEDAARAEYTSAKAYDVKRKADAYYLIKQAEAKEKEARTKIYEAVAEGKILAGNWPGMTPNRPIFEEWYKTLAINYTNHYLYFLDPEGGGRIDLEPKEGRAAIWLRERSKENPYVITAYYDCDKKKYGDVKVVIDAIAGEYRDEDGAIYDAAFCFGRPLK